MTPDKVKFTLKIIKDEVKNIKKHASKAQLDRLAKYLKGYEICPENKEQCIYGVMTGDCMSNTAFMLIKNCTKYKANLHDLRNIGDMDFKVNPNYRSFTPLESFIILNRDQIPVITDFILGKRKTLPLKLLNIKKTYKY